MPNIKKADFENVSCYIGYVYCVALTLIVMFMPSGLFVCLYLAFGPFG